MSKEKSICEKYAGQKVLSLTMNGVIIRDLENPSGKMPLTFDGYQYVKKRNLLMCLFDIDVTPRCIGIINNDGVTSPAYSQFKLSDNANSRYYYYYYLNLDYTKELLHLAKNLRHSLTESQLGEIYVPVPHIDEQIRIADYLDNKCSRIDEVIARERQLVEKLKDYKQSMITEAVTKGLNPDAKRKASGVEWIGDIPEHWSITKIKYIVEFNPSYNSGLNATDMVSFAPMETITTGHVEPKVTTLEKVKGGYTFFADNDIIMAKVTPCFENGNIAIAKQLVNGIGAGSSELYVFRCTNIDTRWMFYFLQNGVFKEQCISTMYGTGGLKRVSSSYVSNYKLAIPSAQEQQQIADYLDKKCAAIDSTIDLKEKLIAKLIDYNKSLIYECVTGKRMV